MAPDSKVDYRQYRRYFVNLQSLYQKPEVKVYLGLTLSLFAVAFFGLFALRPTLITIINLTRELQEKKEVNQKLQEKINNLNQAQANYSQITNSLTLVDQALPPNPVLSQVVLQIEILAQRSNLAIRSIDFESVDLKGGKPTPKNELVFNLSLTGNFEDLKTFLNSLENVRRIITVDSFNFTQSQSQEMKSLTLNISGKAYYLLKE